MRFCLRIVFLGRRRVSIHQGTKLFFQGRVELERFLKVFLRVVGFPLAQLDHSAVGVDACVFRFELEGLVVILECEIELAEQRVCVGAVVKRFGVLGIEFDGLGVIFDGKLVVAQAALRQAAAVKYLGVFRVELLGLIEVLDRFF